MDTSQLFYLLITFFGIAATIRAVQSCPVNCMCRGSAVRCSPGLTGWPYGVTGTVTSLSLSGLPSNHNTLRHIQGQSDLLALVKLNRLVVTYSEITAIDDEAFAGLSSLQFLSLADNELKSLNKNTFRGLPNLRTLDLSGNQNCQFNRTAFSLINDITELNMGDMNITMLPVDIFSELNNLKVLKLYSNRLKTITFEILEQLSFLESLDISDNLLRGLPQTLKPMLNRLRGLHLSDNPWNCSCQLYWFRELKKEFLINTVNGGEVICLDPDTIKYTAFVNVPYSDLVLRCDSNRYTIDLHHTLMVSCKFEGCPVPKVKWIQPGGKEFVRTVTADGQHSVMENGTLIIKRVSMADAGQWTFLIDNGTVNDIAYVTVEVVNTITNTLSASSGIKPFVETTEKSVLSTIFTPHSTTQTDEPTSSPPKSNVLSALTSANPMSVPQVLTKSTAKLLAMTHLSTKNSSATSLSTSLASQSTRTSKSTSLALPTAVAPSTTMRTTVSVKPATITSSSRTKLPNWATHSPFSTQSTSPAMLHKIYAGLILLVLISLD